MTEVKLRFYELASQRVLNENSNSSAFVSLYFVLQAAIFGGIGYFAGGANAASLFDSISNQKIIAFLGLSTTIWAVCMVAGYFHRIRVFSTFMLNLEKELIEDQSAAEIRLLPQHALENHGLSTAIRLALLCSTFLVLFVVLVIWIALLQ